VTSSERLIAEIREEFPSFRVVAKAEHTLQRVIDLTLKIVTLGGQRGYLSQYHTVLGDTLYVPTAWETASDAERVIVLRHERVHLRQRRRYGAVLMTFLYLVPFFPIGLAYGRARIEWDAYTETLRATAEILGLDAARSPDLRRRIVGRFTGPDYGWMWPFRAMVERWYDDVLNGIASQGHVAELAAHGERAA
jgi:hypothetical protein